MNDAMDPSARTHARLAFSLCSLIIEPPPDVVGVRMVAIPRHRDERRPAKDSRKIFCPPESFRQGRTSKGGGGSIRKSRGRCPMKRTVVRYKAKPEKVEENQR